MVDLPTLRCAQGARASQGCISAHLPLVADRAEVLVDSEYDQDEFRDDARKHDADHHAGDRRQHQDEAAERADRHRGQAGKNAGDAEQADQRDHQPVEGLDDGGRDEAVPPVAIRGSSSAATISSFERVVGKRLNSPITADSLAYKLIS